MERVKDRQAKQARELGVRVIGGLRKHRPGGGRPSKYLLSGLLKCDACRYHTHKLAIRQQFCSGGRNLGELSFTVTVLDPRFTALNSVANGINPLPNQFTGGEGAVTGEEVRFDVTFTTPFRSGPTTFSSDQRSTWEAPATSCGYPHRNPLSLRARPSPAICKPGYETTAPEHWPLIGRRSARTSHTKGRSMPHLHSADRVGPNPQP
jgi:hypothetical protein